MIAISYLAAEICHPPYYSPTFLVLFSDFSIQYFERFERKTTSDWLSHTVKPIRGGIIFTKFLCNSGHKLFIFKILLIAIDWNF